MAVSSAGDPPVSSEADLIVSSAPDLAISSGAATSALTPAQQNWIIQFVAAQSSSPPGNSRPISSSASTSNGSLSEY